MYKKNTYLLDKIRQKVRKDLQTQSKLGPTIKQRRKEKDLTLSQLSEKYEVSISYISKVENDLIKPNIDYINPMLAVLELMKKFLNLVKKWISGINWQLNIILIKTIGKFYMILLMKEKIFKLN